ncbi:hypothetical protein PROFUN_10186 [Planoprotostelium fungivorum]|uniref:Fe2OG dioxygenase domain-containing protein n=1 Tax=Planoprotostelium fungivorum TaxID=1890364 RepID=A0A2P6MQ54_9EUKA|nr:hypothetical protein PROFUN_10186 [Planoprotostelium fungivorum]
MEGREIPVIDVGAVIGDNTDVDSEAFRAVASQIDHACRTIGFFYITNFGVADDLMNRTLLLARQLFDLPLEEKEKASITKSPNHRGYVGMGIENIDDTIDAEAGHGDLKEAFDLSDDIHGGEDKLYGPNLWPPALDEKWRNEMMDHYHRMCKLCMSILRAFTPSLGVSPDHFEEMYERPLAALRLLRYPPSKSTNKKAEHQLACGTHTDYGFITLLQQDNVGGLQVQNTMGEWVDALPIPNTLLINLGDMMSAVTNHQYVATPHRVLQNGTTNYRYSIPLFFNPQWSTVLTTFPAFLREGVEPVPPFVFGEHLTARLNATYSHRREEKVKDSA